MKHSILYSSLFLFITLAFTSCKNDLDVLAPGEESISVYGILNPNEPVQNIRINKVYLTEGDALTAAQDPTQINFGPGELTVTLQRFMTGSTTPTLTTVGDGSKKQIVLTETVITTASGSFSQNQRIWQTSDKLYSKGEYKLTIRNNNSGKEFTSQTNVVDSIVCGFGSYMPLKNYILTGNPGASYPTHGNYVTGTGPGTDTPDAAYINYAVPPLSSSTSIRFNTVPNARLYNITMRFHYEDSIVGGTVLKKYIDYDFITSKSDNLKGGEVLITSFTEQSFYDNTALQIAKDNVANLINRKAIYLEYIVYAGNQTLSDFLQINAPSTSIAQDKPNYSNISGGVGIFAAKSRFSVGKDLLPAFIDEIACNSTTKSLRFRRFDGTICP